MIGFSNKKDASNNDSTEPILELRDKIALNVVRLSIWGSILIGLTGIVAVIALTDPENPDRTFSQLQFVFGVILPLWGTWMGTVLAYYFSKENFESANQNVRMLVDKISPAQQLEATKSKDVMILLKDIKTIIPENGKGITDIKLNDIITFMDKEKVSRLPLFGPQNTGLYVIHRSMIDKFISELTVKSDFDKNIIDTLTIKDLLEKSSDDIKRYIENSIKFISENSTLKDAQTEMNKSQECQDVFVTTNGKPDEPVQGWVTNITITEKARL